MKNKIILGCLAAAACEILFGLSFIFTKSITAQASGLALISWRFVTAFFFVNLYLLTRRQKVVINGRNLKPLIRIAILNPIIYFICETIGIRMTTASESGASVSLLPYSLRVAPPTSHLSDTSFQVQPLSPMPFIALTLKKPVNSLALRLAILCQPVVALHLDSLH